LEADLSFVNVTVDGHNPPKSSRANYGSYADVEPLSGKILNERTQLQMNVWLSPRSCNGTMFPDEIFLPTTWWPCVIFDETSAAPKSTFDDIAGLVAYLDIALGPARVGLFLGFLGLAGFIGFLMSLPPTASEGNVGVECRIISVGPGGVGEREGDGDRLGVAQEHHQNATFLHGIWQQIGPPLRYAFMMLRFSIIEGLLLVAFVVLVAHEYFFRDRRDRSGQLPVSYLWICVLVLPAFSGLSLNPHFALRACVAESPDATYWQRLSLAQSLFFIGVAIGVHFIALAQGSSFRLANAGSIAMMLLIHTPLTFYCIGRALKQNMFQCWIAYTLEMLNLAAIYYLPAYRASSAFKWTVPFIFCLTSMFNKYVIRRATWIPEAATPRLQSVSLAYCGFFSRLSQSVVFGSFAFAIGLEVYYAALGLFFRVTLYKRLEIKNMIISRLVENGITKILCWEITAPEPPSERSLHVSSMATIFETVYESACFHYFFVLRFICYPPSNVSGIEAVALFVVCKAIQFLTDALTAVVAYKYEGIVLLEYATVKTLNSEVFSWWVMLISASCVFLSATGSLYDPSIKTLF